MSCISRILPQPCPTNRIEWFTESDYNNRRSNKLYDNIIDDDEYDEYEDALTDDDGDENTTKKIIQNVLLEIVSAMGLDTKHRQTIDSHCKVKIVLQNQKQKQQNHHQQQQKQSLMIHRTDTIRNDPTPIWTAKTKSLCIVPIPSIIRKNNDNNNKNDNTITTNNDDDDNENNNNKQLIISNEEETKNNSNDYLIIEVYHGSKTILATVRISFTDVINYCYNKPNERIEFSLYNNNTGDVVGSAPTKVSEHATLALRFRIADKDDILFVQKYKRRQSSISDFAYSLITNTTTNSCSRSCRISIEHKKKVAADINFQHINTNSVFPLREKIVGKDGIERYRVRPYPDPDRPKEETEYMSLSEIEHTAYQPSTTWVEVGSGQCGKLYIEIIGCDNLPQLDPDIGSLGVDYTDAFVVMAYEDNFVRTDICWDHLSPKFMPWSTRAFQFNIKHPASLLFLSVFDYDEGINPLDHHDPVGRIVLRLNSFHANTTYTLQYPLQDDPRERPTTMTRERPTSMLLEGNNSNDDDDSVFIPSFCKRGTITIRLRVEWDGGEGAASKLLFTKPPHCIINVDNEKSYNVLCYTLKGAIHMNEASITSCKILAGEVASYWGSYCFVIDGLLNILLWRGRLQITKCRSIWFPIHSIFLFTSIALLIERPDLTIPIIFYAMSWILLSINYHESRHPNPWKRVPWCIETNLLMVFGRRKLFHSPYESGNDSAEISPNEGAVEGATKDKLDEMKSKRMSALIQSLMQFMLKVYRIYKKTGDTGIHITTDRKRFHLFSKRLYYIHMLLQYMVQYLRMGRNFIGWKSTHTAVFTTNCIMIATAWLIFPMNTILRWILRILCWIVLGPWMKCIDIKYFLSWYETKDELIQRIKDGKADDEPSLPDFDNFLDSELFCKMSHAGRIKSEEMYKLRDMRTILFGQYSEVVPIEDNSRYTSIPLSQSSTAVRITEWVIPPNNGYYIPGQHLSGTMIPRIELNPPSSSEEEEDFHDDDDVKYENIRNDDNKKNN